MAGRTTGWRPTRPGCRPAIAGRLLRADRGHQLPVVSVGLRDGGRTVVSGGQDRRIRIWDAGSKDAARVVRLDGRGSWFRAGPLAGALRAVGGGDDGHVRVWELDKGTCVATLAFTGSADGTVRIWDLATAETVRVLDGHVRGATAMALDAAATTLLTGSAAGSLRRWTIDWELGSPQPAT